MVHEVAFDRVVTLDSAVMVFNIWNMRCWQNIFKHAVGGLELLCLDSSYLLAQSDAGLNTWELCYEELYSFYLTIVCIAVAVVGVVGIVIAVAVVLLVDAEVHVDECVGARIPHGDLLVGELLALVDGNRDDLVCGEAVA